MYPDHTWFRFDSGTELFTDVCGKFVELVYQDHTSYCTKISSVDNKSKERRSRIIFGVT